MHRSSLSYLVPSDWCPVRSHSAGYAEEEGRGSPPLHQLPQAAQGLEGTAHALRVRETPINLTSLIYNLLLEITLTGGWNTTKRLL